MTHWLMRMCIFYVDIKRPTVCFKRIFYAILKGTKCRIKDEEINSGVHHDAFSVRVSG